MFFFIMPRNFNIFEGTLNTVIILAMTVFLKSTPSFMLALKKNSMCSEQDVGSKLLIKVMKLLKSMMVGLSVLTVLMTIYAVIGMYSSNVLVNTAHMFALTIPMWLTVRSGIVSLIDEISQ